MAGAPMHPVDDPAVLARVLTEADLTGTGETPLASPFTVGNASKARAYAQATAPGDAMRGSSLLEAYARWKAEQASSITKAREATPADIEADALARSKRGREAASQGRRADRCASRRLQAVSLARRHHAARHVAREGGGESVSTRRDGTPAAEPQAARGYSWAPFQPGHTLTVRHGTRSQRLVAERAEQVRAQLLEAHEFLGEPIFAEALERYCRVEARARMLDEYVVEKAISEGVESVPPYLWTEATRADALAQKAAQDCGLDPTGFARAARDLGFAKTLSQRTRTARAADLASQGSALRAARGDGHG